jgi:DNA-binding NarL/FixJ family response regulator
VPALMAGRRSAGHNRRVSIRVLLVDDDARFRALARLALTGDGLEVVGEACDGQEALMLAAAVLPDLMLLDIGLPDLDGAEVARRLPAPPDGPIVILISSRDADYGTRMARGVARGFIVKSELSRAAVLHLAAG